MFSRVSNDGARRHARVEGGKTLFRSYALIVIAELNDIFAPIGETL
jgi:hypothetical protein